MLQTISKSSFKPKVLEYLRMVEKTKKPLLISHEGKVTIRIEPYQSDDTDVSKQLLGSVIQFSDPTEPVGLEDWDVLK